MAQSAEPAAHANIVSPVDETLGSAKFFPVADGVKIELDVIQQVPGSHAVRILSVGKCEGPDFTSAGPPLIPSAKEDGSTNAGRPGASDLPKVEAGLDGHLRATIVARGFTLGEGPNSLFHSGGTAIVVDEDLDDHAIEGDQNSGSHVACGVIQKGGGSTVP